MTSNIGKTDPPPSTEILDALSEVERQLSLSSTNSEGNEKSIRQRILQIGEQVTSTNNVLRKQIKLLLTTKDLSPSVLNESLQFMDNQLEGAIRVPIQYEEYEESLQKISAKSGDPNATIEDLRQALKESLSLHQQAQTQVSTLQKQIDMFNEFNRALKENTQLQPSQPQPLPPLPESPQSQRRRPSLPPLPIPKQDNKPEDGTKSSRSQLPDGDKKSVIDEIKKKDFANSVRDSVKKGKRDVRIHETVPKLRPIPKPPTLEDKIGTFTFESSDNSDNDEEMEEMQNEIEELKKKISELTGDLSKKETEIDGLNQQMTEVKTKNKKYAMAIKQYQEQVKKGKTDNETLEKSYKLLKLENQKLKSGASSTNENPKLKQFYDSILGIVKSSDNYDGSGDGNIIAITKKVFAEYDNLANRHHEIKSIINDLQKVLAIDPTEEEIDQKQLLRQIIKKTKEIVAENKKKQQIMKIELEISDPAHDYYSDDNNDALAVQVRDVDLLLDENDRGLDIPTRLKKLTELLTNLRAENAQKIKEIEKLRMSMQRILSKLHPNAKFNLDDGSIEASTEILTDVDNLLQKVADLETENKELVQQVATLQQGKLIDVEINVNDNLATLEKKRTDKLKHLLQIVKNETVANDSSELDLLSHLTSNLNSVNNVITLPDLSDQLPIFDRVKGLMNAYNELNAKHNETKSQFLQRENELSNQLKSIHSIFNLDPSSENNDASLETIRNKINQNNKDDDEILNLLHSQMNNLPEDPNTNETPKMRAIKQLLADSNENQKVHELLDNYIKDLPQDPNNTEPLTVQAIQKLLIDSNNNEKVTDLLEQYINQMEPDPNNPEPLTVQAIQKLLNESNNNHQLNEVLNSTIQELPEDPNNTEPLNIRAIHKLLANSNDSQKVHEILEPITQDLPQDPNNSEPLTIRAIQKLLADSNHNKQVTDLLEQYINQMEQDPNNPEPLTVQAIQKLLKESNNNHQINEVLNSTIKELPKDPNNTEPLNIRAIHKLLANSNDNKQICELLGQYIDQMPKDPNHTEPLTIQAIRKLLTNSNESQQVNDALNQFMKDLPQDPNNNEPLTVQAIQNLLTDSNSNKQINELLDNYIKDLPQDPNNTEPLTVQAIQKLLVDSNSNKRINELLDNYIKDLPQDPNNNDPLTVQAIQKLLVDSNSNKQINELLDNYIKDLPQDPNNTEPLTVQAIQKLLIDSNDNKEISHLLENVIHDLPQDPNNTTPLTIQAIKKLLADSQQLSSLLNDSNETKEISALLEKVILELPSDSNSQEPLTIQAIKHLLLDHDQSKEISNMLEQYINDMPKDVDNGETLPIQAIRRLLANTQQISELLEKIIQELPPELDNKEPLTIHAIKKLLASLDETKEISALLEKQINDLVQDPENNEPLSIQAIQKLISNSNEGKQINELLEQYMKDLPQDPNSNEPLTVQAIQKLLIDSNNNKQVNDLLEQYINQMEQDPNNTEPLTVQAIQKLLANSTEIQRVHEILEPIIHDLPEDPNNHEPVTVQAIQKLMSDSNNNKQVGDLLDNFMKDLPQDPNSNEPLSVQSIQKLISNSNEGKQINDLLDNYIKDLPQDPNSNEPLTVQAIQKLLVDSNSNKQINELLEQYINQMEQDPNNTEPLTVQAIQKLLVDSNSNKQINELLDNYIKDLPQDPNNNDPLTVQPIQKLLVDSNSNKQINELLEQYINQMEQDPNNTEPLTVQAIQKLLANSNESQKISELLHKQISELPDEPDNTEYLNVRAVKQLLNQLTGSQQLSSMIEEHMNELNLDPNSKEPLSIQAIKKLLLNQTNDNTPNQETNIVERSIDHLLPNDTDESREVSDLLHRYIDEMPKDTDNNESLTVQAIRKLLSNSEENQRINELLTKQINELPEEPENKEYLTVRAIKQLLSNQADNDNSIRPNGNESNQNELNPNETHENENGSNQNQNEPNNLTPNQNDTQNESNNQNENETTQNESNNLQSNEIEINNNEIVQNESTKRQLTENETNQSESNENETNQSESNENINNQTQNQVNDLQQNVINSNDITSIMKLLNNSNGENSNNAKEGSIVEQIQHLKEIEQEYEEGLNLLHEDIEETSTDEEIHSKPLIKGIIKVQKERKEKQRERDNTNLMLNRILALINKDQSDEYQQQIDEEQFQTVLDKVRKLIQVKNLQSSTAEEEEEEERTEENTRKELIKLLNKDESASDEQLIANIRELCQNQEELDSSINEIASLLNILNDDNKTNAELMQQIVQRIKSPTSEFQKNSTVNKLNQENEDLKNELQKKNDSLKSIKNMLYPDHTDDQLPDSFETDLHQRISQQFNPEMADQIWRREIGKILGIENLDDENTPTPTPDELIQKAKEYATKTRTIDGLSYEGDYESQLSKANDEISTLKQKLVENESKISGIREERESIVEQIQTLINKIDSKQPGDHIDPALYEKLVTFIDQCSPKDSKDIALLDETLDTLSAQLEIDDFSFSQDEKTEKVRQEKIKQILAKIHQLKGKSRKRTNCFPELELSTSEQQLEEEESESSFMGDQSPIPIRRDPDEDSNISEQSPILRRRGESDDESNLSEQPPAHRRGEIDDESNLSEQPPAHRRDELDENNEHQFISRKITIDDDSSLLPQIIQIIESVSEATTEDDVLDFIQKLVDEHKSNNNELAESIEQEQLNYGWFLTKMESITNRNKEQRQFMRKLGKQPQPELEEQVRKSIEDQKLNWTNLRKYLGITELPSEEEDSNDDKEQVISKIKEILESKENSEDDSDSVDIEKVSKLMKYQEKLISTNIDKMQEVLKTKSDRSGMLALLDLAESTMQDEDCKSPLAQAFAKLKEDLLDLTSDNSLKDDQIDELIGKIKELNRRIRQLKAENDRINLVNQFELSPENLEEANSLKIEIDKVKDLFDGKIDLTTENLSDIVEQQKIQLEEKEKELQEKDKQLEEKDKQIKDIMEQNDQLLKERNAFLESFITDNQSVDDKNASKLMSHLHELDSEVKETDEIMSTSTVEPPPAESSLPPIQPRTKSPRSTSRMAQIKEQFENLKKQIVELSQKNSQLEINLDNSRETIEELKAEQQRLIQALANADKNAGKDKSSELMNNLYDLDSKISTQNEKLGEVTDDEQTSVSINLNSISSVPSPNRTTSPRSMRNMPQLFQALEKLKDELNQATRESLEKSNRIAELEEQLEREDHSQPDNSLVSNELNEMKKERDEIVELFSFNDNLPLYKQLLLFKETSETSSMEKEQLKSMLENTNAQLKKLNNERTEAIKIMFPQGYEAATEPPSTDQRLNASVEDHHPNYPIPLPRQRRSSEINQEELPVSPRSRDKQSSDFESSPPKRRRRPSDYHEESLILTGALRLREQIEKLTASNTELEQVIQTLNSESGMEDKLNSIISELNECKQMNVTLNNHNQTISKNVQMLEFERRQVIRSIQKVTNRQDYELQTDSVLVKDINDLVSQLTSVQTRNVDIDLDESSSHISQISEALHETQQNDFTESNKPPEEVIVDLRNQIDQLTKAREAIAQLLEEVSTRANKLVQQIHLLKQKKNNQANKEQFSQLEKSVVILNPTHVETQTDGTYNEEIQSQIDSLTKARESISELLTDITQRSQALIQQINQVKARSADNTNWTNLESAAQDIADQQSKVEAIFNTSISEVRNERDNRITELEEINDQLKNQINEIKLKLESQDDGGQRTTELEEINKQLKNQMNDLNLKIFALQQSRNVISSLATVETPTSVKEKEELENDLEEKEKQIQRLQSKIESLTEARNSIMKLFNEVSRQANSLISQVKELKKGKKQEKKLDTIERNATVIVTNNHNEEENQKVIQSLNDKINELTAQLQNTEKLQQKIKTLQEARDSLSKLFNDMQQRSKQLIKQIQEMKAQNSETTQKDTLDQLETEIKDLCESHDTIQTILNTQSNEEEVDRITELENEIHELRRRNQELEKHHIILDNPKQEVTNILTVVSPLHQNDTGEETPESLQKQIEELREARDSLTIVYNDLSKRAQDLRDTISKLKSDNPTINEYSRMEGDCNRINTSLEQEKKLIEQTKKIAEYQHRIVELEAQLSNLSNEVPSDLPLSFEKNQEQLNQIQAVLNDEDISTDFSLVRQLIERLSQHNQQPNSKEIIQLRKEHHDIDSIVHGDIENVDEEQPIIRSVLQLYNIAHKQYCPNDPEGIDELRQELQNLRDERAEIENIIAGHSPSPSSESRTSLIKKVSTMAHNQPHPVDDLNNSISDQISLVKSSSSDDDISNTTLVQKIGQIVKQANKLRARDQGSDSFDNESNDTDFYKKQILELNQSNQKKALLLAQLTSILNGNNDINGDNFDMNASYDSDIVQKLRDTMDSYQNDSRDALIKENNRLKSELEQSTHVDNINQLKQKISDYEELNNELTSQLQRLNNERNSIKAITKNQKPEHVTPLVASLLKIITNYGDKQSSSVFEFDAKSAIPADNSFQQQINEMVNDESNKDDNSTFDNTDDNSLSPIDSIIPSSLSSENHALKKKLSESKQLTEIYAHQFSKIEKFLKLPQTGSISDRSKAIALKFNHDREVAQKLYSENKKLRNKLLEARQKMQQSGQSETDDLFNDINEPPEGANNILDLDSPSSEFVFQSK